MKTDNAALSTPDRSESAIYLNAKAQRRKENFYSFAPLVLMSNFVDSQIFLSVSIL